MDGANLVLALLGSGVIGSVGVAIVQGFTSKRKLSAEATSIISEAAGGIVVRLENENLRITSENASIRTENKEMRERLDRVIDLIRAHLEYDRIVARKLAEAGIEVPPAPPLEIPEG